jgi:hypothetical protein
LGTSLRLIRRGWTRQRVIEVLQTAGWTLPLTLLLWVWAQDQQIEEATAAGVRVVVRHADAQVALTAVGQVRPGDASATPDAAILSTNGDEGTQTLTTTLTLTLRGSRAGLDEVLRPLREQGRPLTIMVAPDPADRISLDLRPALAELDLFADAGVVLTGVSPPTVDVRVEPVGDLELPIVAGGDLGAEAYEVQPVFEPSTVRVVGPAALLGTLGTASQEERVVVALVPEDLPTGRSTRSVPVGLSPALLRRIDEVHGQGQAERLDVVPDVVEAILVRRAMGLVETEVPTVPIWIVKPAAMEGRATVLVEGMSEMVLNNVSIRGPRAAIDAIESGRLSVRARLSLESGDLFKPGPLERPIEWQVPEGVTVLTPPPTLRVRLEQTRD